MVNPRVFLDFNIEGQAVGRVIFELFADVVPKTCENFRQLCTGAAGVSAAGDPLHYKSSLIHRVVANFMVAGGDIVSRNGKGSESIYGGLFDDEDLSREIDVEGLLVMANKGKNSNGSQWFVSLRPCPHLAGKHVVFGRVVKGYDVIEGLSKLPVNAKDVPDALVTVSNCGELELRKVVKKPRSPSPTPSRSASPHSDRSRSRSVTPPPREKKKSSKRHHERDENGKRIKKSKKHRSSRKERTPSPVAPTAEELAIVERKRREAEDDAARERQDEERRKANRARELEEYKIKHEREGGPEGVVYKGRGAMHARADGSSGRMRGW